MGLLDTWMVWGNESVSAIDDLVVSIVHYSSEMSVAVASDAVDRAGIGVDFSFEDDHGFECDRGSHGGSKVGVGEFFDRHGDQWCLFESLGGSGFCWLV